MREIEEEKVIKGKEEKERRNKEEKKERVELNGGDQTS